MHKALTIAGSDSGGGAGIQTDLKTFAALGVYGTSVITALTAQNTLGVHGIHAVPPDFIRCQMEAVLSDIPVQAAKTGMLGESEAIMAVVETLTRHRIANLVVDPVMVAQSGHRLLKEDAVSTLREKLLPLALVTTPNLAEAGVLLNREIHSVDEMVAAARDIHLLGPRTVLVKGGHLEGNEMTDVFFDGKDIHFFTTQKIDTNHTHGTGCTYAAAIAAYLARGYGILDAVQRSKEFITSAIAHGLSVGQGYGPTNPMGTLWRHVEENLTVKAMNEALELLSKTPEIMKLLPGEESNLFACIDGAADVNGVAAFTGGIRFCSGRATAGGQPEFGISGWPSHALLAAHNIMPSIQAVVPLRYTAEIIEQATNAGWIVDNMKTGQKSDPAGQLYNLYHEQFSTDGVPHILAQKEPEPVLLVFGKTPQEAVEITASLARCFRDC